MAVSGGWRTGAELALFPMWSRGRVEGPLFFLAWTKSDTSVFSISVSPRVVAQTALAFCGDHLGKKKVPGLAVGPEFNASLGRVPWDSVKGQEGGMGNVSAIRQQPGKTIGGACGVAYWKYGSMVLSFIRLLLAQLSWCYKSLLPF